MEASPYTASLNAALPPDVSPSQSLMLDDLVAATLALEGIDLSCYRRATLERRVAARMRRVGCANGRQYLDRLIAQPGEARELIGHVMVKVSRFFRNATVFESLRSEVIPRLFFHESRPLRVWSAGCATGEEAYSIAILLLEAMEGLTGSATPEVTATDVDVLCLEEARKGLYTAESVAEMPSELVARYFSSSPGRHGLLFRMNDEVRPLVNFARHDLVGGGGAPSNLGYHLVLCRNVAIYYDRSTQARLYDLIVRSLLPGGYLCLGEAEQLPPGHRRLFASSDKQSRIYRRLRPGEALDGAGPGYRTFSVAGRRSALESPNAE